MRIGKKAWLILGATVMVTAIVIVAVLYFQQAGERDALNDRLAAAEARLPELTADKGDLEDQLASATESLETNKAKFPESVESIEYGEYLFEIAEDSNVELEALSFPDPAARTIGPATYSVVSLTLPLRGTLEDIFAFIDIIRTDARFASTEVTVISIDVAGSTATIRIDIYGYKG